MIRPLDRVAVASHGARRTRAPLFEVDLTTALCLLLITSGLLAAIWWLVSWPGFLSNSVSAHF